MLAMKTLKSAGWLVLSRLLGRAIDFAALLVLARSLAPQDFGLVALAMTLIAVVDIVLEVPVAQALTRLPDIDRSHLDTGFTLGLLRGLLIGAAVLASAWPFAALYGDPQLVPVLAALAAGPIGKAFYSPAMTRHMRDVNFAPVFLAEFAGKLLAFAAAMSAVALGAGYWALVLNFVTAACAATAASYVLAPYRPALSLTRFKDFAGFIGWFSAAQAVGAVNWQIDRLLLGAQVEKAALGRYAMAGDLAVMPTQSLIGPAMQPVMAAFSRIGADPARRAAAFLKAARFAMLASAPASIGIALTADLIVAVLLGPRWIETGPLLRWLALTVIAVPYFQTIYALALATDRPSVIFRLNLADLALKAAAVPVGLAAYSVAGVVGARGLVACVMALIFLDQGRRLAKASIRAQLVNLWKIIVAAGVMTGAVLALRALLAPMEPPAAAELAIAVLAGGAAYGAALLALGVRLSLRSGRLELTDRWW